MVLFNAPEGSSMALHLSLPQYHSDLSMVPSTLAWVELEPF